MVVAPFRRLLFLQLATETRLSFPRSDGLGCFRIVKVNIAGAKASNCGLARGFEPALACSGLKPDVNHLSSITVHGRPFLGAPLPVPALQTASCWTSGSGLGWDACPLRRLWSGR